MQHLFPNQGRLRQAIGVLLLLGIGHVLALASSKPLNQYIRTSWNDVDGLPIGWAQAVLQTGDGYLWVATQDGLLRFDGLAFKKFNKNNTPGIKHNDIRALLEDKSDGALWIGTFGGGLTRDDHGKFHSYATADGLPGNFIRALAQDSRGVLWVGTDKGLAQFQNGRFQRWKEIGVEVISLAVSPEGALLAATDDSVFQIEKGKVVKIRLPFSDPKSVYFDRSGKAWIGTGTHGLYMLGGGKLVHYDDHGMFHQAAIARIYQDQYGNVWTGNSAGSVCRLAARGPDCLVLKGAGSIGSIDKDREGNIWIGTEQAGIVQLRDAKFVTYDNQAGLADDVVWSVLEARDKSIWIGTAKGLSVLKNGEFHSYRLGPNQLDNIVESAWEDQDGTMWFGTDNGLKMFRHGKVVRSYTKKDGLAGSAVHAIYRDRRGNLWLGDRDGGFTRYKDGKFTALSAKDGLASDRVRVIAEDDQNVWLGTEEGLTRFHDGTFTNYAMELGNEGGPAVGGAVCIYEDSSRVLWIGTYGSGLVRFQDGQMTPYTVKDGLPDESIWSILEDGKGNLWMSTASHGLFRIAKAALNDFAAHKTRDLRFTTYGVSDGLPTTNFDGGSQSTGLRTTGGKLLFASSKGVVEADPENLPVNFIPPQVVIEEVMVNRKPQEQSAVPAGLGELDFHFAALSFVAPEMVRFKYKLEGFDKDWNGLVARRDAHYTNIPPGAYTFRVTAANSDGVWNNEGTAFPLHLKPLWRQTRWFYALCGLLSALLLALLGAAGYRLRMRQIRLREEELVLLVNERTRDLQQEILEHEKTERALQAAKEAAEAATRAKSEFLANMSHEIRTPLNGVMGMLELVKQMHLTPEMSECMGMAQESANTLLVVINDILDFSKVEAGKLEFESREFDLAEAVSDAARTMALRAHQKKLELAVHVAPGIGPMLVGDPARLKQVLINLIGNAIKFTDVGEVVLRVERQWRSMEETELKFSVSDTGIGVPEDKQRLVFEAFEQADASITRKFGGTGLGLAICSRIVHSMGGRIWVHSAPGQGATFSFTARFENGTAAPLEDYHGELSGLRVLIVDDNQTNRYILQQMVRQWGMNAEVVDSGKAALEALLAAASAAQPFPLLLADYRMPEMSGVEMIQRIKALPEIATTSIMMLTSDDYHGTALRCAELGVEAYLIKPVKQSELLASIRRLMVPSPKGVSSVMTLRAGARRGAAGKLRILLAEDNVVNQKLARRLLENMGHEVVVARTGLEALSEVGRQSFDLIFMDVQMPEMDGFAATEAIREWEKSQGIHTPIVAMTAHAMKGDEEMCLNRGMNAYLSKPINPRALEETIHQVLDILKLDMLKKDVLNKDAASAS